MKCVIHIKNKNGGFTNAAIISFRVLQDSMSSTYEDEGPYPWFRTEMAIYYIVYFVVFPFFFVNIFVALVIVTFNELGEAELTDNIDKNQVRKIFIFLLVKLFSNGTRVGLIFLVCFLVIFSFLINPASQFLNLCNCEPSRDITRAQTSQSVFIPL